MSNKRILIMRHLLACLTLASCGLFAVSISVAAPPKIEEKDNIYYQKLPTNIGYIVDKGTEICMLKWLSPRGSPSSPVIIDCSDLAKRPEWKPIISWVED
jgi:hypothetical protein